MKNTRLIKVALEDTVISSVFSLGSIFFGWRIRILGFTIFQWILRNQFGNITTRRFSLKYKTGMNTLPNSTNGLFTTLGFRPLHSGGISLTTKLATMIKMNRTTGKDLIFTRNSNGNCFWSLILTWIYSEHGDLLCLQPMANICGISPHQTSRLNEQKNHNCLKCSFYPRVD